MSAGTDTVRVRVDVWRHPRGSDYFYFSVVLPGDYAAKERDRPVFGGHCDADDNPLRTPEQARAAGKAAAEARGYEVIR